MCCFKKSFYIFCFLSLFVIFVCNVVYGKDLKNSSNMPKPDIEANGSDDPVTIPSSETLSLSISLDPGKMAYQKADWWIASYGQDGWSSFVINPGSYGWEDGIQRCIEMPLVSLDSVQIPPPTLSKGKNTIIFAVDDNADGKPNVTWWDAVEVNVTGTDIEYDMYEYFPFKSGNEWTFDSGDKLIITHNTEYFPHISREALESYIFEDPVEPAFLYTDDNGYYCAGTKDYDDPEDDKIFDPPLKLLNRYYSMGEEHTTQTGGITFDIKLESKENIETPAGVFENCLKFVYDISDSGAGTYREIVWFAKNVGPVKIERPFEEGTYDGCCWSCVWAFDSNDKVIDRTTYLLDYDVTN